MIEIILNDDGTIMLIEDGKSRRFSPGTRFTFDTDQEIDFWMMRIFGDELKVTK